MAIVTRGAGIASNLDNLEVSGEFAELAAATQALKTVHRICCVEKKHHGTKVLAIMDSKFAADIIMGIRVVKERALWAQEGKKLVEDLRRVVDLEIVIVPAHGKDKKWRPTAVIDHVWCRTLNAKADQAATAKLSATLRDSERGIWQQRLEKRQTWQRKAIRFASEVHDTYLAYFARCM